MTATQNDIVGWFKEGQEHGATHMIVVHNTFDHENFPVYVLPGEDVRKEAEKFGYDHTNGHPVENGNCEKVEEVYSLTKPMEPQIDESRAFHFD